MDREISFRGKRTDNGEWVEGYYLYDGVSGKSYIHVSGNSVNESDKVGQEGYLRFVAYEIDSEPICQYTGLTDKSGQEIWENDILCACGNLNDIYQVYFGEFGVMNLEDETITDKVVGWYMKVIPTEDVLSTLAPFNADMPLNEIWVENCELEVIGNVYANPALLKRGD